MALNSKNFFGSERATRYKLAMDKCPTARYLEILPLLCHLSTLNLKNSTIFDFGSGTGYLANIFEGIAKSVLRVDKSEEMLIASGRDNYIVADMSSVVDKVGTEKADIITSLASFHHLHVPEAPNRKYRYNYLGTRKGATESYLNITASRQIQYSTIQEWTNVLVNGGILFLIDVVGYPDKRWNEYIKGSYRFQVNNFEYYQYMIDASTKKKFEIDKKLFTDLIINFDEDLLNESIIQKIINNSSSSIKLSELILSYDIPDDVLKGTHTMVPADFFDDVIDELGSDYHYALFPRESEIETALYSCGMTNVACITLPTPWIFNDSREAAWFVHELFGLGQCWDYDNIPNHELKKMEKLLNQYLGMYENSQGKTVLFWQLGYFIATK